ncbi:GntR family transcriptional regulator [Paenibacillus ferrarius]|uniref:GntR family transcriptional regulator n=1 Tax=Paenibacillus ferrarius TaxID=1469647 RepID=UPI003D26C453
MNNTFDSKNSNAHDTLDHSVYHRLREMILKKEFSSGEPLIQNQLTSMLGVSRTPIRKAMAELEMEGLLERTPKGWLVKEFSMKDMISVFELRAVLEGLACRLYAEKVNMADIAYMKAMFQHALQQTTADDASEYYKTDLKFHQMIVKGSEDVYLAKTIESCNVIETTLRQGLYRDPKDTYSEHLAIIEALENGDGDRAEELMKSHIRKAISVMKSGHIKIYK